MSHRPEWLDDFRRKTLLIDVIDEAFDPQVSDKTVRDHLKAAAKDLGDLFMGPGPEAVPGGKKSFPRRRR